MTTQDVLAAIAAAENEGARIRLQLGIDTDGDPEDEVKGTVTPIELHDPADVAIAGLFMQMLDKVDATPGDNQVEFREKAKIKVFSFFRLGVEFRLRIELLPAE